MADHTGHLRASTHDRYERGLAHAYRAFGRTPISDVDENDIAKMINQMRKAGRAGWTIRASLSPVSMVMRWAVRRGMAAYNPCQRLEKGERPKVGRGRMRILERDEITKVLEYASVYWRPLFTVLLFTGMRVGEALALRWCDVDRDNGVIRVRSQIDRKTRALAEPKTEKAKRDVVMFPALANVLREQRLAAPPELSHEEAFVFPTAAGTPREQGNARVAFQAAAEKAGLEATGGRGSRCTTAGTRSRACSSQPVATSSSSAGSSDTRARA